MDSQQLELYNRIMAFSLNQPADRLSFSDRLARDNEWSLSYSDRVIEEYKKFTFLAVTAGHPVTPSEQIDRVWHLHLIYTRSYWQEFCPKVLQTSLHHEPTRGGSTEKLKFEDWYGKTLASYQQFFGQIPPIDIWGDPHHQFGKETQLGRTKSPANGVWEKLSLGFSAIFTRKQSILLSLGLSLAVFITGCQITTIAPNPLNFAGWEFLTFYFLLSLLVLLGAFFLRVYLRLPYVPAVPQTIYLDEYENAYLAEGKNRAIDTAIIKLIQNNYITVKPEQRAFTLIGSSHDLSHPVDRTVAEVIGSSDGRLDRIYNSATLISVIANIHDRLVQLELLTSKQQSIKAQTYPAILILAAIGLGIAKILVGISRDKPTGFLAIMCAIVTVCCVGFWTIPLHRSRYGDRVLQDIRNSSSKKIVSLTDPQIPLMVALFGVAILPDRLFADLKKIFMPVVTGNSGGADGSGGDSGSCGSSCGSCGGGCGGCGGGD